MAKVKESLLFMRKLWELLIGLIGCLIRGFSSHLVLTLPAKCFQLRIISITIGVTRSNRKLKTHNTHLPFLTAAISAVSGFFLFSLRGWTSIFHSKELGCIRPSKYVVNSQV